MPTLHEVIRVVRSLLTTAIVPSQEGNSGLPASIGMLRTTLPSLVTIALCILTKTWVRTSEPILKSRV